MSKGRFCASGIMCFAMMLAGATTARGDVLVNVDFNSVTPTASPTYSGAAVLGAAGDQWNGISQSVDFTNTAQSVSNLSLFDSAGAASSAKLSYTLTPSPTFAGTGGFDVSNGSPFFGKPGQDLMRDYLYAHGGTGSFTISGLTAGDDYKLVLYSGADSTPIGAAFGRDTAFTLDGGTKHVVQGNNSTFVAGANYTTFDTIADAGGTITFSMATGNTTSLEPDINGFQLLAEPSAVPLPASALGGMVLIAGLAVVRMRRR